MLENAVAFVRFFVKSINKYDKILYIYCYSLIIKKIIKPLLLVN